MKSSVEQSSRNRTSQLNISYGLLSIQTRNRNIRLVIPSIPLLWPGGMDGTGCEFEFWQCQILIPCSMFIEPTITRVPLGFSGYIWLDTRIVFKKNLRSSSVCGFGCCRSQVKRSSEHL